MPDRAGGQRANGGQRPALTLASGTGPMPARSTGPTGSTARPRPATASTTSSGDVERTGRRDIGHARGEVDRATEDVAFAFDDASAVHARMTGGQAGARQRVQEIERALDGRPHMREPQEHAVAEEFHDASAMPRRRVPGQVGEA